MDNKQQLVLLYARHWQEACSVNTMVYSYQSRDFLAETFCGFCHECEMYKLKRCDYLVAHQYSSFEAERWNGLYIYICPLNLVFISTTVSEKKRPIYVIISGPIVMGALEDVINEVSMPMIDKIKNLPQHTPSSVSALSKVQWSMAMYLSGKGAGDSEKLTQTQRAMHNSLYDVSEYLRKETYDVRYPIELEQRLRKMIKNGDKEGARELINKLLGAIYFSSDYNFADIRSRAKELVVLFSRAAIEGGADVRRILGKNGELLAEVDTCRSLDDLSILLTSIFHRFVGYVFDFNQFENVDIMYKATAYIRENLSKRVSLDGLASSVGLSRSYLSALFKNEMGVTFTDYVNSVRVEKSKELLLDDSLSLADIAILVGYSDQSYFTKKFTKLVGMTPGQYRKKRNHLNE